MNRLAPSATLTDDGIVAVLRADRADRYLPVVEVLAEEGVRNIELTLTTPGTIDTIASIANAVPQAEIGVGTVLRDADAIRAIDAGARFLVTPNTGSSVIDVAVSRGIAIYAGAMTPSEAFRNWDAGVTGVKIFPASTVGASFVSHLHGPFPDMQVMPSGGVALDDIEDWIRAGSIGVSLGGPLLGDALKGGSLDALRTRAQAAIAAVAAARESA